MTFIGTQLHLVNRTLRQAGQCEARPTEEQTICSMAAWGHSVGFVADHVILQRSDWFLKPATQMRIER